MNKKINSFEEHDNQNDPKIDLMDADILEDPSTDNPEINTRWYKTKINSADRRLWCIADRDGSGRVGNWLFDH